MAGRDYEFWWELPGALVIGWNQKFLAPPRLFGIRGAQGLAMVIFIPRYQ
jgi:hypothetical protein